MTTGKTALCIVNNLHLYGAVLAPHGLSGAICNGVWTCASKVPPYYSNAITVTPDDAEGQARTIAGLAVALDRPFAVKDSFASLDLGPQGFRPLFSANWIWRDVQSTPASSERWQAITTPEDLASWEVAWNENGSPAETRVFLPTLLADDTVGVLASWHDERIVAGCIANWSDGVVGFSNFFTIADRQEPDLAAAITAIASVAPGRAIAGYEHGDRLEAMVGLGFKPVGTLRVWLSPAR